MKSIGLLCSSNDKANLESRLLASSLIQNLVKSYPYQYVMGAGSTGIMRMSQELLQENDMPLEIIGIKDSIDFEKSLATYKVEAANTFERTAQIYRDSDILLFLSGGVGTLAEFYGMVDANLENEIKKPILVYNADHSYDFVLQDFKQKIKSGFADTSILSYFEVVTTEEELFSKLEQYEQVLKKER